MDIAIRLSFRNTPLHFSSKFRQSMKGQNFGKPVAGGDYYFLLELDL